MKNFSNSSNKIGYRHILIPKGLAAKLIIDKKFLRTKQVQYEKLYNYIHESES